MTKLTSKKLLVAIIISAVVLGGSVIWFTRQAAEAAVLDPHPGLVGWWRFDEGAGDLAQDSSGFENHATKYGGTWTDGKYGKALDFDGVDDYVEVFDSGSLDATVGISIEFWIKLNSINTGTYNEIIRKTGAYGFKIGVSGQVIGYRWGGPENHYSTTSLIAGTWSHVAMTYDGSLHEIYVNGNLENSESDSGSIPTSDNPLRIGGRVDAAPNEYISGTIDEIRIYNRALSSDEIQQTFKAGVDSKLLAKIPKGTTQVILTLSWQGNGSISVAIESPSTTYTEDNVPVYQKTTYSTSGNMSEMLNIKRISISTAALSSDENWYVTLEFDEVENYRISVEVQR